MAQINVQKYSKELQEILFPDSSFYKASMVDTGIAPDVTTINIPLAGQILAAGVGNPAFPLTITERTDSNKTYSVAQVYAKPVLLTVEDAITLSHSYDKRRSILSQMASAIELECANIAAYNWACSTNVGLTTGSTRASDLTGATGTRKAVTKADFLKVKNAFDKMNLPGTGQIYGLLPVSFVNDLLGIAEFVDYDKTGELSKLQEGKIARILGMNLKMRHDSVTGTAGVAYTSASAKVVMPSTDRTANLAVTDSAAAIFWHSDMAIHAEGNARMNIDENRAEYLGGTIMSATVRFGAAQMRADETGFYTLIED